MRKASPKSPPGALLVAQSGGCTAAINASLVGVIEEARRHHREVTAVLGARHGIEGILRREISDLGGLDCARLERLARTPSAALGSCRRKAGNEEIGVVLNFCRDKGIRFFHYIGGNDSADTAHRLARAAARAAYDLRVVSIPKTIDNDLPVTDHCPGFGSAARFIATTVADVGLDTEAMRRVEPVKIIEVMGRNAGWLVASAALAKRGERDAPQFVWPPEIPFDRRRFLRLVRNSLDRIGYCVIAVAETLRDARGRPVSAKGRAVPRDAFGHPYIVGAAETLCELVREKFHIRARWDKPGTLQRMSSLHLSETDLAEARACGQWAVRSALRGKSDAIVVMRRRPGKPYRIAYDLAPLADIANSEKRLPSGWFDADRMLPKAAFRRYALPLIGALPEHERL